MPTKGNSGGVFDSDIVKLLMLLGTTLGVSVGAAIWLDEMHARHPHEDALSKAHFELYINSLERRIEHLESGYRAGP